MSNHIRDWENNSLNLKNIRDEEFVMDHFFLLLRKWKLITLITLLLTIAGVSFIMSRPLLYKAEATLIVSSGDYSVETLGNDEITRNQRLVSTYAEIARSKHIVSNVIRKLDMEVDPEKVVKTLKMEPVGETELIKISYRDKNPQIAAIMVNEISKEFIQKIREVMIFQNLKVVERAEIPNKALPKKTGFFALIFLISGFFLGTFIVILQEFLYGKLKDPRDFEAIMEAQVLANIPNFKEPREGENNE